ncbi:hypothetical protein GQ600_11919 [Phytophthora cactorum]|nr:hypothetical protein GQ600_11919 [Phytophthora cactorum]
MARTHKTVQIKAKMAEQEHAAEEARRAGLARLRAARTRSERSQAREMMQKDQAGETSATAEGDTQESAEEAADEAVEEEADGEIAQEDASASDDDEADDEEEKAADEAEEDEDAEHKQEELTQVPAFKTQHDSWASLELCLKEYMEATRQKIVVIEVVNLNTTDCPFQMLAQVTKRRDGSWGIVMKREVLLDYQRHKEEQYRSKVEMPGTLRDVSYSEELNVALGMTTCWVAAAIKTQYDIATDAAVANNYTFSDNGATITIKGGEREYLLEKDGLLCDCEFSQTMKLPCRHTMVYRKSCGNPFIIPFSSVAPQCFGQCRLSQQELTEVATPFVAKICKAHSQAGGGSLSEAEKYRHAQQSFRRISGELARFGDHELESAMSQLDQWWYNLRNGQASIEQPASSQNDDREHDGDNSEGEQVKALKDGLAHDEEIELDSDGDRAGVSEVYVVSFEKVEQCDSRDFAPKTYKVAQKKKSTEGLLPATTLDKIVVDRGAKLVKMYDSMGGKRNRKRLQNMAAEIRAGPLHDDSYNDLEVTEPMQTDSDSCGVFVCRLFWTCVSSKAPVVCHRLA